MAARLTREEVNELLDYNPDTGVFRWKKTISGRAKAGGIAGCSVKGYRRIGLGKRQYAAHRLAWLLVRGAWPAGHIDHINGNPSDNRIANLRAATFSENLQNQRRAQKRSKSGLLGVSFHKAKQRWRAQIAVDGVGHHIGYFDTADAAYEAYLKKKREVHVACTI